MDGKNKYKVEFVLIENNEKEDFFKADIILINETNNQLDDWKLCLDFFRPSETNPIKISDSGKNKFNIIKNIAEYNEIQGLVPLPANSSLVISIKGNWVIRKYTDTPSCYFLVTKNESAIPVLGTSDLSIIGSTFTAEPKLSMPSSEQLKSIRLTPAPAKTVFKSGELNFDSINSIIDNSDSNEADDILQSFLVNFKLLIKKSLTLDSQINRNKNSICLQTNSSLQTDCYILNVNNEGVLIEANSNGGYLYGLISLFKLAVSYNNRIPCLTINDAPRFAYRGILFDVARNFRTVTEIKKFLTMMSSYKLNVFHCRMTDDEGWRLEIKKYPNIAEIGGYRGYGEIIPSLHGSGHQKVGGYYKQSEIREIIDYANSLNITFIPEIVVPSHSRALIMSFTDYNEENTNPLAEKNDKSVYITPQSFTDNILNPGLDFTYTVLDDIYRELISLFKVQRTRNMPFSEYIHIGVDEVPEGAWMKSPACKILMDEHKLKTTDELQYYFIRKIQDIITKYECKTAGWEEIINGGSFLNKDIMVYSWLGEEAGFEAAESGFSVVMTPAQYLYFDLAYSSDVTEPGLYWADYNNPKVIYSYDPLPSDCSKNTKNNIKGIQACLWSECLGYPKYTNNDKLPANYQACPFEYMAFPKMTAYSEVAWSNMNKRSWNGFVKKYTFEKEILDIFSVKYRINPLTKD